MPETKAQRRAVRQTGLLGMSLGKANNRFRKSLLFSLAGACQRLDCFRCGKLITSVAEFSIEHKEAWEGAANPQEAFFALENIAFSHLKCNIGAARKVNRKYADKLEYYRINFARYYERHSARWNEIRSARRRKTDRPYRKRSVAQSG